VQVKPEARKSPVNSSRMARGLLLNTLDKLAADDSDLELSLYVQAGRDKLRNDLMPDKGQQKRKIRPTWLRHLTLTILATTSIPIYLALSSPYGIVIQSDGSILGLSNIIREKIQGNKFWRQQLATAQSVLDRELDANKRQVEFDKSIEANIKRGNEIVENLYKSNPALRPSPAEQYAEALRDEADRVEAAELKRQLEESKIRRIVQLETIVGFLKKRL
jgi:hypothetical protein